MKKLIWILVVVETVISTTLAVNIDVPSSTNSYLTVVDKIRLKKVLEPGLQLKDLPSVHYAVLGYKLINEPISKVAEICEFLINSAVKPSLTTEQIYYIASSWKNLEKCQPKSFPLDTITKTLTNIIEKEDSAPEILYYSINSLTLLGKKMPDSLAVKVSKNLQVLLKKGENLLNMGYIFNIAADLGPVGAFAFNHIEEAIVQADEVDGQLLQFEGGLSITSLVVNGIFKLSSSLKKKPPLTSQQIVKLANYFLSRLSVQIPKGAVNLLSSIVTLATNPFEKPICITLSEDGAVISSKQTLIRVRVCDLLGNPLVPLPSVIVNAATKVGEDVVVISKKKFEATSDKTIFHFNFMSISPEPGFYNVVVSAGQVLNSITIKVIADIKVDFLEIGTADADQTTQPKLVKVAHPELLNEKIEADFQQKLVVRFALKDNSKNKAIRVHQAFVRLSSLSLPEIDKHEIIFVAEADPSHIYKFDMPVGSAAKNFDYQNGDYKVELIIGDAVLSNSFQWKLATVSLKFPEPTISEVAEKSIYKQKPNVYSHKTEIKHMFREPEKRPPVFVSNLFTGLCLSPLLLLFTLWAKIGINVSNFPLSMSAILFHSGLGSTFALFGVFWLKLNMFTTLQYLLGLGLVTFLSGNKLLSQIARNRKASR